jgi:hypothetical protein
VICVFTTRGSRKNSPPRPIDSGASAKLNALKSAQAIETEGFRENAISAT